MDEMPDGVSDEVRKSVQQGGGLHYVGRPYLNWIVGDVEIELDGRFSIDDIEAIAAYMRRHGARS